MDISGHTEVECDGSSNDLVDGVRSLSLGSLKLLGRELGHSHCEAQESACKASFLHDGTAKMDLLPPNILNAGLWGLRLDA